MKTFLAIASSLAALCLVGCANQADSSAREWERAECIRVNDKEDRERCLERANSRYGTSSRDTEKAGKR